MASIFLKPALEQILKLNPTDGIETVADVVTDNDKQLLLNVRDSLRLLVDNLNQLGDQPSLNLFNRDFYQIFVEMIAVVQDIYKDDSGNPLWTDFRDTNIGTVLLKLLAGNLDKLYFLTDRHFAQYWAATVSRLKYFLLKAKDYGFRVQTRLAASAQVRISISEAIVNDIVIGPTIQITTTDGQFIFEVDDSVILPSGEKSITVPARNWVTNTQQEFLTGQPNTRIALSTPGVIDDPDRELFTVLVGAEIFIRVDDFLASKSTDAHFTVEILEDESAAILFGDGTNGKVPIGGTTITYKTGGGRVGNGLQIGAINRLLSPIFDITNTIVPNPQAVNTTSPTGGADRPSIDLQVIEMIKEVKNLTRTVTTEDYEDNVASLAGVARGIALDNNNDPAIPIGEVHLLIVPEAGSVFDANLEQTILDFFDDPDNGRPKTHNIFLRVFETQYEPVDIAGTVFFRQGTNTGIITSIVATIRQFFDPSNIDDDLLRYTMDWGYKEPLIAHSQIIKLIQDYKTLGVERVVLTTPTTDVPIGLRNFPIINSINLAVEVIDNG